MSTLRDIRQSYQNLLGALYDQEEIQAIFRAVLQQLLGYSTSQLMLHLDQMVAPDTEEKLSEYLQQLATGKPLQYILGVAPFYGLELKVNPATLIPRPETEELVDYILNRYDKSQQANIIDIGTGSGCIATAIKRNWDEASMTAVDISSEALKTAEQNALKYKLDITFRCLDILEWPYSFQNERYDIIISNPPYVTRQEIAEMNPNVLSYEPHSALFVEDEAPLLFYDYIADFALAHLTPKGELFFEINQYLSAQTKDLLIKKGFQDVEIFKDINSADRYMRAKREK